MQVIAVGAPRAGDSDIRGFADEHFPGAPVVTYIDRTGDVFETLAGNIYPNSAWFDANGDRAEPPGDWPVRIS